MTKMTPAKRRVLEILQEGRLMEVNLSIYKIQRATMNKLVDDGFARWVPHSKPEPCWKITPAGKNELK